MKLKILARRQKPLPTREALDARNPKRAAVATLAVAAVTIGLAARWWAKHGGAFLAELAFRLETIYVYWTLVASPLDRKVWTAILIALALAALLLLVLLHRFVWRAAFPDFVRLDPRSHPGGRPERVGRLYRIRTFQDAGATRYRHYYKHGDRWLPLFRFDHVDLDEPAHSTLFGVSMARCGRLDSDPDGNRFRHIATQDRIATQPLATTFREAEVTDDQLRKTSIVGPGPGMNPDVMRRKWQSEPSMIPRLEQQTRALLPRHAPSRDPRVEPQPEEERV